MVGGHLWFYEDGLRRTILPSPSIRQVQLLGQAMAYFQPSCASPPLPPTPRSRRPQPSKFDLTASSSTSLASEVLGGLTAKDVEVIDEIIRRAPPTTTTFLNVFKAYNEVLKVRGLDSGNDVVYYKILLKIGVVRGSDWGSKWDAIKEQFGYGSGAPMITQISGKDVRTEAEVAVSERHIPTRRLQRKTGSHPPMQASSAIGRRNYDERRDDVSESELTSSPRTLVHRPSLRDFMTRDPESDGTDAEMPMPSISQFIPTYSRRRPTERSHGSSIISSETKTPLPPLNRQFTHHTVEEPIKDFDDQFSQLLRMGITRRTSLMPGDAQPDKDDAWKKIEQDIDEKYAEDICIERLLDHHFHKWKKKYKFYRVR